MIIIPATFGLATSQLQVHQKIYREYSKSYITNQLLPFLILELETKEKQRKKTETNLFPPFFA